MVATVQSRILDEHGQPIQTAIVRRMPSHTPVRARYDAAVTTDDNRRHWANADGLSADAAANPAVRQVLRNRARYEAACNSYANGIVATLANDTIGTGPRLQVLADNKDHNRQIERAFMQWAIAVRLPEKLRTMRRSRATDGEGFILLGNNPKLASPVKLDPCLMEADRVTTPTMLLDPTAVDGIVFDSLGNPVEYHVLKHHPGDTSAGCGLDFDRLPADTVIHYYRADRPGQSKPQPD